MSKIQYIALKLTPESKNDLIEFVKHEFNGGHGRVYCDHITLAYGSDEIESFDNDLFGEKRIITVGSIIYDENAAAVPIDPDEIAGLGCNNEHPHITLTTVNSIRPVYSNKLLKDYYDGNSNAQTIQLDEQLILTAIVEPVYMSQLNESRYFNPSGPICYYDGSWHDMFGHIVVVSETEETDICTDMADMENISYAMMPEYIMLDGYETIDEIAENYLGCNTEDAFIYYNGTDPNIDVFDTRFGNITPTSQVRGFSNSLYMLASLNDISDLTDSELIGITAVEIADINGHITRHTINVFDIFMKWVKLHNASVIYCDARESTSDKIINSQTGIRLLKKYGFADIARLMNENENMISHVFVDIEWYNNLTPTEREELVKLIN